MVVVVILTFNLVEPSVSFTVPLKDTTVPEENSVVLECEVSKPGVKPKWLKGGKEINYLMERSIKRRVLLLKLMEGSYL